ncbi:MAG: type II secretion system protein [Lentisphaeria bacterium]|nr:type II secretion system protein [Lentisphaeria bacterium]
MKHPRQHFYSLIELLVVIAVIVILAGILIPSLRSARESARRAQCLANQKNLGVYVSQYAQNNNQKMSVIANWSTWYRDLLNANGGMKDGKESSDNYLDAVQKNREDCLNATGLAMVKVFKCPADTSEGATASYGRNNPSRGGTMKYKDGSNGSSAGDAIVDPRLVNSRLNDPQRPSDLILITDHWGPNHQPGRSCNTEEYETVNAYHLRIRENDTSIGELGTVRDDKSRHKGAPPILYVDGHVTVNNWMQTIPTRFHKLTETYGGSDGLGWQGRAVGSWSDAKCVKK